MTNPIQHDHPTDPHPHTEPHPHPDPHPHTDPHADLNKVIDYLWAKEHADYHQQDADDRTRHILGPLTRLRAQTDTTGQHSPHHCCTPNPQYAFLVPGWATVNVTAPTEAAARDKLALEGGDTIELHNPPLTSGALTITGLDLVPAAAKLDQINDTLIDGSLPDADFHISDIARVAARILNNDKTPHWTATAGPRAVTGYLENKTRDTGTYTLSVAEGTLQLQHERWDYPCFELDGDDLPTLAEAVATAVLDDLCSNTDCGQSTADGKGYEGECGTCADRTDRARRAARAEDTEDTDDAEAPPTPRKPAP
ncbi:hypothetical protein [Streptomyces rubiginosohelvolus]|uniref:hypothetical protein n=1 Tax=Streptomyces rubiginosohelvolus TaxID=67362 RepID=UPI003710FCD1